VEKDTPRKGGLGTEGTSGAAERISFSRRGAGGGPPRKPTRKRVPGGELSNSFEWLAGALGEFDYGAPIVVDPGGATWGVRADRVGAKPPQRAIAAEEAGETLREKGVTIQTAPDP
jgi:hypothetical protein